MIKMIGRVTKVTTRTCNVVLFQWDEWLKKSDWNPYVPILSNMYWYDGGSLSLGYEKNISDNLIGSIGYVSEFGILDGVIISVEKLKKYSELIEEAGKEVKG